MASLEPWGLALVIIAGTIVGLAGLYAAFTIWAQSAYVNIKAALNSQCDIDAFVGGDYPVKATKCVLAHKLQLGKREPSTEAIPLECFDSPHVAGLKVSRKSGTPPSASASDNKNVVPLEQILSESTKTPIVIATIRMGFGHHRLAYSAASWALQSGHPTIFHDLLNITSDEADLIKSTDALYSKFSRMATELGGPVERFWGSLMKQGDADALRIAALTAAHLQPLLLAYPKDICMITTHQLVALTAAAAGFTNVVNLVVDNYPQWFLTVPKTLNIVQGPVNYQTFLKMGVRPSELQLAGHWNPIDLVKNIDEDCQRRIDRCKVDSKTKKRKPVRLLIPVGGAGAQRKFIISLIKSLAPLVKNGSVQLLLNAGDHEHMKTAFLQVLDEYSMDFQTVTDTPGVMAFQKKLLDANQEPAKPVTLFAFSDYFPAVATTDILCRVADVLTCKPSELAFYCLPKLHVRRVGDHEGFSAIRASELGDGTPEAREIEDALAYVDLFLQGPDLLVQMNDCVVRNNKIGVYDGCKRSVELVMERATK